MKKILIACFSVILLITACKEKYVPNLNLSATSFLVVEGFINSGTGPTVITLTRTNKIIDTSNRIYERGAVVSVQGESGTSTQLTETSPGVYSIPQVTLNAGTRYRIDIKTQNGKEYQSDFSDMRKTPDIDSVSWNKKDGGVQIYANTHDATNNTRYYQWTYNQTWEFHSKYINTLVYTWDSSGTVFGVPNPRLTGVRFKDPLHPGIADSSLLICWKSDSLSSINIGSSEKLSKDVISEQPMVFIPPNTQQLSVLYSINVSQFALSDKAYRFLQQMKKNTEQLGTIFDAQPSDNVGNMHCLSDPKEVVIGFIEVTEAKLKRIFISNAQVPDWHYQQDCDPETQVQNDSDYTRSPSPLRAHIAGTMLTTVAEYGGASGINKVYVGPIACVNCTLSGVNKKPSFWP